MHVEDIKKGVGPACREFGVRRLDAFGSIVRGAATATSDVDLLVEFATPNQAGRFFDNRSRGQRITLQSAS